MKQSGRIYGTLSLLVAAALSAGAVFALTDRSYSVFVGLLLLIGLAVKAAIRELRSVTKTEATSLENESAEDASTACSKRFFHGAEVQFSRRHLCRYDSNEPAGGVRPLRRKSPERFSQGARFDRFDNLL